MRYLARYVHRSALSDKRLKGLSSEGRVMIQWQNSKTKQIANMHLKIDELIRRWLQHVLPKGFFRLRHFGFMSPAASKTMIFIRLLLGELGEPEIILPDLEPLRCVHCKSTLSKVAVMRRRTTNKAPPI